MNGVGGVNLSTGTYYLNIDMYIREGSELFPTLKNLLNQFYFASTSIVLVFVIITWISHHFLIWSSF